MVSGFPASLLIEVFLKGMLKLLQNSDKEQVHREPCFQLCFLREGVCGQEGKTGSKGFMGVGEKTLRTRHWVSIAESQQCFSVQVSGNMAKLSILVIQVPGPR